MTAPEQATTAQAVLAAAGLADLPLTAERAGQVAGLLAAWLPGAHALNRRMQADDLRSLMPAVVFTQGPAGDADEEHRS